MRQIGLALGFLARMIASCVVFGALAAYLVHLPFAVVYELSFPWWQPAGLGAYVGGLLGWLTGSVVLIGLERNSPDRPDLLPATFRWGFFVTLPMACAAFAVFPLVNELGICASALSASLVAGLSARYAVG